jgi:hypothetical protein
VGLLVVGQGIIGNQWPENVVYSSLPKAFTSLNALGMLQVNGLGT